MPQKYGCIHSTGLGGGLEESMGMVPARTSHIIMLIENDSGAVSVGQQLVL